MNLTLNLAKDKYHNEITLTLPHTILIMTLSSYTLAGSSAQPLVNLGLKFRHFLTAQESGRIM
jgi:hypothetical protein